MFSAFTEIVGIDVVTPDMPDDFLAKLGKRSGGNYATLLIND